MYDIYRRGKNQDVWLRTIRRRDIRLSISHIMVLKNRCRKHIL